MQMNDPTNNQHGIEYFGYSYRSNISPFKMQTNLQKKKNKCKSQIDISYVASNKTP